MCMCVFLCVHVSVYGYIRVYLLPTFFLIELEIFLVADINEKISFPKFRENRSMSWIATLPSKFCKCHLKSKFQNYGRMVVDSLKRSSQSVEKENI